MTFDIKKEKCLRCIKIGQFQKAKLEIITARNDKCRCKVWPSGKTFDVYLCTNCGNVVLNVDL